MKIAILGAGNSGCALAADYAGRGHNVTLIKTSDSLHNENFRYLSENGGKIEMDEFGKKSVSCISHINREIEKVQDQDVVMICTQTGYHLDVLRRIVSLLHTGQILMMIPGYLSTAYAMGLGVPKGVIVAEAESNFIDGRLTSPGYFKVGFRNVRNPIGIYPAAAKEKAEEVLEQLGTPFTYLDSVVEAALHNPNMIVHTVGAIMSIPRIEYTNGEYCMYHEVFTPSVWRMLEALDSEKMKILERLRLKPVSYVEACKFRNSLDEERDGKEVFFDYASMPERAKGPVCVKSRYITEDVPQGLVLMESLAKVLEIPVPTCTSLIELATVALPMDCRGEGRTIEKLGRENIHRILEERAGEENYVSMECSKKNVLHGEETS